MTGVGLAATVAEQTEFVYDALPVRVVFGPERVAQLKDEVARLGVKRILVLCTPGRRVLGEQIAELIGRVTAKVLAGARMHMPVDVAAARRSGWARPSHSRPGCRWCAYPPPTPVRR